ncbi:MAG TPA: rRNA maturation RNase YbeY [Gemmatimonadales bacterium]|nr:rRNA maturation RNase YbeY [Gemmatimonadales bacterium]
MAASRRAGSPRPRHERPARLRRAADRVLAWEGARGARVEVTLLDAAAMRRLNRRACGRRGLTDVIAFALPQPNGTLLGDVYVCPDAASGWVNGGRRRKETRGRVEEELLRLAVHGTLHVLGYDHPEGSGRTRSAMWRRQERYVQRLVGRAERVVGGAP